MKRKIFVWMTAFCFSFFALTLRVFADNTRMTFGDYVYTENDDGTITIVEYTGTEENLVIPSSIDAKTVTALGPNQSGSSTNYGIQNRDQLRSVQIPGTVKTIGNIFFGGCFDLERIEMENGVETIDVNGFSQCYSVKKIFIPASVKTGGFMRYMTGLRTAGPIGSGTDIEFGWTEEIPSNAFANLMLDEVKLPDTITKIGDYAFRNTELTILHMPAGLRSIGKYAFNTSNCSIGLTIPAGVTEIGEGAFMYMNAPYIIISEGIESLPASAFDAAYINSVYIPSSVSRVGKRGLCMRHPPTIYFGGSEEEWNAVIFENDEGVSPYPDQTKVIFGSESGQYEQFSYVVENNEIRLLSYTGTDTVLNIPSEIDGYPVTTINERMFSTNSHLEEVTVPDTVTSIGQSAFQYCENLKTVTLPEHLTKLENRVFSNCQSLETVHMPADLKEIGSYAFFNCENLDHILIPDGIESIGEYAFFNCIGLSDLSYPDHDFEVGSYAFGNCTALQDENGMVIVGTVMFGYYGDETEVTVPEYITVLDRTFYNRGELIKVSLPEGLKEIRNSAFYNCSALQEIKLPESVRVLGSFSFSNCSSLTEIQVPEGVERLENQLFYKCTNLSHVILPDTVTWIGSQCFGYCGNLNEITIPAGTTTIQAYAFQNCTGLQDVYYSGSMDEWNAINIVKTGNDTLLNADLHIMKAGSSYAVLESDGDFIFFRSENYYANGSSQTAAEDIEGNVYSGRVFKVPENDSSSSVRWSSYASSIKTVSVADHQTIAPISMKGWFSGCYNMTSFEAEGFDTSGTTDMTELFYNCAGLTSLDLTGFETGNVTSMKGMFSMTAMTGLDISGFDTSNVTDMSFMFEHCKNIESLDLGHFNTDKVTNMYDMFIECYALKSVNLGSFNTDNVTNMKGMFLRCRSLEELDLSGFTTDKVTDFSGMFGECSALKKLDIGGFDTSSAQYQDSVFNYTTDLNEVRIGPKTLFQLPEGVWVHKSGNEVKSALQLYTEYPENGEQLKGTWTREQNLTLSEFEWKETDTGYEANAVFSLADHEMNYSVPAKVSLTEDTKPGCETEGVRKYSAVLDAADSPDRKAYTDEKIITSDPVGHIWGEWAVTKDPSCLEEGTETRVCENDSSHTETKPVEALGHDLIHTEAVPAGCETEGNIEYWTCQRCHKYFTDEAGEQETNKDSLIIPAKGHDFGEWTVSKEPSCLEEGTETRVCKNDPEHVETRPVEALGHDLVHTEAVPAGCETEGNTEYWTCQRCGKYFSDSEGKTEINKNAWIIPAIGHDYGEWETISASTCTEEGLERRVCTHDSSHTEERTLPATGHNYGNWETVKEPTCTEEGQKQQVCANDSSHVNTETIPAIGHKWGSWITGKQPTCKEEGYEFRVCENDSSHTETNTLAKIPHSWGEWTVVKSPTFEEEGITERTCSVCGEKQTTTIPVISHEHTFTFIEAKDATCEEEGNIAYYYCSVCDRYYKDEEGNEKIMPEDVVIPALGHDYGEWETISTATCTEDGLERRVCRHDSSHTEERTLPAAGHNYGNWVIVKEPDCEEEGLKQQICANDSSHVNTESIPALGHKWGNWTRAKEPSCTEEGEEVRVCENNEEHKETNTVSALGHSLTKTEAKAPTVKEEGNTEYWTCERCGKYFSDEAGEHEIEKDSWIIPKLAVPESLEISEGEKIELATLDTQQLTVKILPENADNSVIWTSSNEKVASVDENGVVTANVYGKVTITAVSKVNPELKDTIEVQTRFHDVNDSTQSYYKPVYWGADNGVVAGYDGGVYFGPDNDCTRAQFVTFLWRLAGRQTGDKDVSFPDVDPNESYYRAVKWAVSEGIIVGYKHEDGPATFEPNGTVTRGQVATMLWRFAGRKTPDLPSTSPFSDIDASNSSYRAVVWGQKAGVIRGYKDGTFQPDASCLRQHIVTFLYRYARDVMGKKV